MDLNTKLTLTAIAFALSVRFILNQTKKLLKFFSDCLKDHKIQNSIREQLHKVTHTDFNQTFLIARARIGVAEENSSPASPNAKNAWRFSGDKFSFIFTDTDRLYLFPSEQESFSVWESNGSAYFQMRNKKYLLDMDNLRKIRSLLEVATRWRLYAFKNHSRRPHVEPDAV